MIRLEKKEDWRETENLIREAFWNVYRPGCSEHYVMHVLRDDPAFIPELDFVMEQNGRLIGQNMFMKTVINADDGREIPVLTEKGRTVPFKLSYSYTDKYVPDSRYEDNRVDVCPFMVQAFFVLCTISLQAESLREI